jgi:hypothetical protein
MALPDCIIRCKCDMFCWTFQASVNRWRNRGTGSLSKKEYYVPRPPSYQPTRNGGTSVLEKPESRRKSFRFFRIYKCLLSELCMNLAFQILAHYMAFQKINRDDMVLQALQSIRLHFQKYLKNTYNQDPTQSPDENPQSPTVCRWHNCHFYDKT